MRKLSEAMDKLSDENSRLLKQEAFLEQEAKLVKAERETKSALKLSRANARKLRVRDAMSEETDEFRTVLSLVKGKSYADSRIRIAPFHYYIP
ncbi:unnamed protein product [Sphagnum tenellum]